MSRMLLVQQICKVLYSMHHTIFTTRKRKSPHARRPTDRAMQHYEIHQIKKETILIQISQDLGSLNHHQTSNTSSNREPLGSNARRASSAGVRSDRSRADGAGRVGGANTAAAGHDAGDLSAVAGALAVEPESGGRDGEGDGQGGEVGVSGSGNGGSVLDDSGGAAESHDGGRLDGAGRGDVGGRDGGGGCEAGGGCDGGGAGPDGGAGHVAVAVDAALGADGGVDAGELGGGDVGHGCGRGDSGSGRGGCVARGRGGGRDRSHGRAAGRRSGRSTAG
jgi:hypothetical protein